MRSPCLFLMKSFVFIFNIDNLIVCGEPEALIEKFKVQLSTKFKVKYHGKPKQFLGIKLDMSSSQIVILKQPDLINRLLKSTGMPGSKAVRCPVDPSLTYEGPM